jgi:O-antigen ligase
VERAVLSAIIITVFAAMVAFGSDRNDFALLFSGVLAVDLLIILVCQQAARALPKSWNALLIPGVFFVLCLCAVSFALLPYSPDGPHPIWSYVDALPAVAIDRSQTFIGILKLTGLGAAFVSGWLICGEDRRARAFFRVFIAVLCAYAFGTLLLHAMPELAAGFFKSYQGNRLAGTFQSANTAGTLFGIGCVYALCLVLEQARHGEAVRGTLVSNIAVPLIAVALLATCLFLTASRGAILATLISVSIFAAWEIFARNWRGLKATTLLYGLLALATVAVFAWSSDLLFDRLSSISADWAGQRAQLYTIHWDAYLASPWLGYGLGSFDEVNKLLQTPINYPMVWNIRAVHNVYLGWLEEAGIVGAVPMFGCIGFIIIRTALGTVWRRRSTTWLRGSCAASLVVLIHGWSDFTLEVPAMAMLWALLLGAGYALSASRGGSDNSEKPVRHGHAAVAKKSTFQIWPIAAGLFSGAAALACLGAFCQVDAPFGFRPLMLPIAPGYAYEAQTSLNLAMHANRAAMLDAAQSLTMSELNLSPASDFGWLRLADILKAKRESVAAISHPLDVSYLVAPLDPLIFDARTRFVLENWGDITPGVRQEALAQMRVGWQNWMQRPLLLQMSQDIKNPTGRLAANLEIALLDGQK